MAAEATHLDAAQRIRIENLEGRQTVAVVGAGPAGITIAEELAKAGINVSVFDRAADIGGTVRLGHTPGTVRTQHLTELHELVQAHPDRVKIYPNVTVGEDISIAELKELGYAAVVLAIGTMKEVHPNIPGIDNLYGHGVFEHRRVRELAVRLHGDV